MWTLTKEIFEMGNVALNRFHEFLLGKWTLTTLLPLRT